MKSLTDFFLSHAEEEKAYGNDVMTLRFFLYKILPDLQNDGFEVPSRRTCSVALAAGLEPLPKAKTSKGKEVTLCLVVHFLNLLWLPIIKFIESLTGTDDDAEMTVSLKKNNQAILNEMSGIVDSPDSTMDMDEWAEFVRTQLLKFADVHVPTRLILQIIGPLVPLSLEPTPANAMHLLRTSLCCKLVGPALASQVSRKILAKIADVPVTLTDEKEMNLKVKENLVTMLEDLHCPPEVEASLEGEMHIKKKHKRDAENVKNLMANKTDQVRLMLEQRVSATRMQSTVLAAADLIDTLLGTSDFSEDARGPELHEALVTRHTLMRHLLLLDGAVDRVITDKLYTLREQGNLAGVALATDESPPAQARFRGLRFQITVIYTGFFVPQAEWMSSSDPPIRVSTTLGDICHCPGKKGIDVAHVLDKQLGRLGLNCFDVVSCTGDGGGENEGLQGVHAHFENFASGYVRRRCLPHISWRTADQAADSSGLKSPYKSLAAYLVDGITWSRLREIAVQPRDKGGLGLFKDGSVKCKEIFGKSPSAIITTRPETDLKFLTFLRGKEVTLYKLAQRDLDQRELSAATVKAVASLGNITQRIKRSVLAEILERCMFLLYWNAKHNMTASSTSWDELVQQAEHQILDLTICDRVLLRFKTTRAAVDAMDPRPRTWLDLAVLQVVGAFMDLYEREITGASVFHRQVAGKAASHLMNIGHNTYRTPWLAAKLLMKDKQLAKNGATALLKIIDETSPANRTAFEQHLFESDDLWQNLTDFANAEPPALLWQDNCKYEALFRFLAPRFLLAPDHVLDAERVHARWQWICSQKRSIKFQNLNGSLRIMHHLEHNSLLPSHTILLPHLQAEADQHRLAIANLDEDTAPGWRLYFWLQLIATQTY